MSLLEDLMVEEDLLIGDPSRLDNDENRDENDGNHEDNTEQAEDSEEQTKKRVTPKKRVKNPQVRLNPDLLRGPRGLSTIESYFKDIKFKGKGYEKEDLDRVMWRLQHWCHRLYPKFQFDDCLKKIEKLGSKRVVQTYVNKIRYGLMDHENQNTTSIYSEEIDVLPSEDVFSELLEDRIEFTQPEQNEEITEEMTERMLRNQEIARQRLMAKRLAEEQQLLEYQNNEELVENQNSSQRVEFTTENSEQPNTAPEVPDKISTEVTKEQKERMERQRQLAIQKRLERLKKQQEQKLQNELSDLNETADNTTIELDQTEFNF